MSLGLSGITAINLTDTGSTRRTFTINGWTGGGTITGVNETLVDTVSSSVALSNGSLAVTGLPSIGLSGFTVANLTDSGSGHTFTLAGWTGAGSLSGTGETVAENVSGKVTLTNGSLAVGALPALSLSGFTAAKLTDTGGGNTFGVGGWTGAGSLADTGSAADSITANKSGGFTLSNAALSSSDGMSLGLSNFGTANLTDTGSGHTFTITGWTRSGTFQGSSESLVDAVSSGELE